MILDFADDPERRDEEKTICPSVSMMKPILRFLQLLCENHNAQLQVSGCDTFVMS